MSDNQAKDRLLNLLDHRAFEPVLRKSADDYDSDAQRDKLSAVQGATRRERDRYYNDYSSAEDIVDNFHDDLHSEEARDVERDLRALELPALRDIQGEFDKLAEELGIG